MKTANYTTTFLLLLLFGVTIGYSQNKSDQINPQFEESEFIFKGKVTSLEAIKNEQDQKLYASYIITIETIYKGENTLKAGRIEFVTEAPDGWSITGNGELIVEDIDHPSPNDKISLSLGTQGVFLGVSTTGISNKQVDNSIAVAPYCNKVRCFYQYLSKTTLDKETNTFVSHKYVKGFNRIFEKIEDFNTYLEKSNVTPTNTSKKKSANSSEKIEKNKRLYAERVENRKKYESYLKKRISKLEEKNLKSPLANEELILQIANQQLTGVSPQFFEFDILVSSNTSTTFLDNAAFVIEYNTVPFGTNIVANNKITITRGANFPAPTYADPSAIISDEDTDRIRGAISINYTNPTPNRTQLTSSSQLLAHISIELLSCEESADITFIDILGTQAVAFFTLIPTEPVLGNFSVYDSLTHINPGAFEFCPPPIIFDFNPKTITAGTNSVLTIEGIGFGNNRGNGQVILPNGDDPGMFIEALDPIDYGIWNDTLIEVILPSRVDTAEVNGDAPTAGSGNIGVRRDDGATSAASFDVMSVPYSIRNASVQKSMPLLYRKVPFRLVDPTPGNLDTGRVFYLDTSITSDPRKEDLVRQALKDWSCLTGVSWKVKGDTTINLLDADGVSVIFLADLFLGSPLGRTKGFNPALCVDATTNEEILFHKETDIALTRTFGLVAATGWFFDGTLLQNVPAGLHDFYLTVQHELGHAHQLAHVNDDTDLMHPSVDPGPTNLINRYDLLISTAGTDGGRFIMDQSVALDLNNCAANAENIQVEDDGDCQSPIGIKELYESRTDLIVYPNPMNSIANLNYILMESANVSLTLHDYSGKQLAFYDLGTQSNGTHQLELDMTNYSSGFYFVKARINDQIQTLKIIKQ